MNVATILKLKAMTPLTVKPGDTIATLCERLRDHRVGAAVVSTDGVTVEGVITERDVTYGIAIHKAGIAAVKVSDLMTREVITCAPADSVGRVASTMQSHRIRHMPVVDNGRLAGMVSIRDVLNSRVAELHEKTAMLMTLATETPREVQDRE